MPSNRQPPLYQCHKKVRALRITGFRIVDKGAAVLRLDQHFPPIQTPEGWVERFRPRDNDLGYVVWYEDGFMSWSPSKAFDEGYTLIKEASDAD